MSVDCSDEERVRRWDKVDSRNGLCGLSAHFVLDIRHESTSQSRHCVPMLWNGAAKKTGGGLGVRNGVAR